MRLPMRTAAGLLLAAVLAAMLLPGCRAFNPETVVVNHPPQTYVTGSPAEGESGQFHYHMYWQGTDQDGEVVKYVWALTDGTIQDFTTDEDEEDLRFNPAENATTLKIAHWTTKTDSIFDFQIDQGSITSADFTFHIAAIDDRGDYDRTPARLYFLSNALGQPLVTVYSSPVQTPDNVFADYDTIGYGRPFEFTWTGTTPNTRSYTPELLAARDTVPPLDGLYGFKYRLPTDVSCDETSEDCWNPRRYDPAQNRLVSYFGDVDSLTFANDDSGESVSKRRLAQGVHTLLVNTIDVAGVEVRPDLQDLNFVLNYDPETYLLGHPMPHDVNGDGVIEAGEVLDYSQDPFYPDDQHSYPYYEVYNPDGTITTSTFADGDRVPQRSVVHFKAIGWDDNRDLRFADIPGAPDPGFGLKFQARFDAVGYYLGGQYSLFRFNTQYSDTVTSVWDDRTNPAIGSADTASFVVGSFDYNFRMRSVDEHQRRDGTPDVISFYGNFPPAVECVQTVPAGTPSGYPETDCSTTVPTFFCPQDPSVTTVPDHPDWIKLDRTYSDTRTVWFSPITNAVWYEEPNSTNGLYPISGHFYGYDLLLYAEDHVGERLFFPRRSPSDPQTYGNEQDRIFAWRYQIVSHRDSLTNFAREGGGTDDLTQVSATFYADYDQNFDDPLHNGVWRLHVDVFIPDLLQGLGPEFYRNYLAGNPQYAGWTENQIDQAFNLTTMQLGLNTATVIARDATSGVYRPDRCAYVYYSGLRVAQDHDEGCDVDPTAGEAARLRLSDFCLQSEPFTRQYRIKSYSSTGVIYPPEP